jgi:hypothetical protein
MATGLSLSSLQAFTFMFGERKQERQRERERERERWGGGEHSFLGWITESVTSKGTVLSRLLRPIRINPRLWDNVPSCMLLLKRGEWNKMGSTIDVP